MITHEIELALHQNHPLKSVDFADLQEALLQEKEPHFYLFTEKATNKTYFLTPQDLTKVTAEEAEQYIIYPIPSSKYRDLYKKKQITLKGLDLFSPGFDIALCAIYADGFWQFGEGLCADYIAQSSSWEIGTNLAFPIGLSLVSGVLRYMKALQDYKVKHGVEAPQEVKDEMLKDCAAYVVKCMVVMGCWELGEFAANMLLTVCGATPATFWAPLTVALCVGLFQAFSTVATQIADEKLRFGEIRSSQFELAKMFVTNFICGALWYAISCIPFGSLLKEVVLEPLAQILGASLAFAAEVIVSYLANTFVPVAMDKTAAASMSLSFFKSDEEDEEGDQDGVRLAM